MPKPKSQSWLRYPLTNILGSPANLRVLRELFRHGGDLSVTSLAERAGMSTQGVREALDALVRQQVIDVRGGGHARLFAVRRAHPLSPVLDGLFRSEEERFNAIIQALRAAAGEEEDAVQGVWLYGSVARGEDVVGSDVDIAVVSGRRNFDQVVSNIRDRIRPAEEMLVFTASVVGLDPADVLRLSAGDSWWTEVTRDAITIAGVDPEALAAQLRRRQDTAKRRKSKRHDAHGSVKARR